MPVDVYIQLKDGNYRRYSIPLTSMFGYKQEKNVLNAKPWSWTKPEYRLYVEVGDQDIEKIIIDQGEWTADIDRSNNVWPLPVDEEEKTEEEE